MGRCLPSSETVLEQEGVGSMEGEPSQPPNSSWPPSQNGSYAESANLTSSSYYQHSSLVAATFIVAYVLIFLLCMVGNTLVCFIVLRNRHMRTVTNVFILNLAVSDLLVGIFCMPTTLVDNLITGWPFDNVTCKMSGLVQGRSVSASVFTLVAIAVERFRCIMHPFHENLTLRKALVTIVVIWALALLIMSPSAIMLTVTREEHHFMVDAHNRSYPLSSCWEAWPEPGMRQVYTAVLFSHIYLAPLMLIVVMYALVARQLVRASVPSRAGEGVAYSEWSRRLLRTRPFVEVQPSDSALPSGCRPSSGPPRPGRLPLRNGRVAHHGLAGAGPGGSPLPLTTPTWGR